MTELVHLSVQETVATITLDSPGNRNALSRRLVAELDERLAAAQADPAVRVVVLAAEGPAFCAGADLAEASGGATVESTIASSESLLGVLQRIVELNKPVVARVHGPVRAGGIGLVGACDIVICADEATFAFPEVRLGLTPAIISLTVLPRMAPRAAAYAFLSAQAFGGREAVRLGLATESVPAGDLDVAVRTTLAALTAGSPQGLAESKRLVAAPVRAALAERGGEMVRLSVQLFASAEAQARIRALRVRTP